MTASICGRFLCASHYAQRLTRVALSGPTLPRVGLQLHRVLSNGTVCNDGDIGPTVLSPRL